MIDAQKFDDTNDLERQIEINLLQLRDLIRIARTDRFNITIYAIAWLLCTSILGVMLFSFVFPSDSFGLNKAFIEYSGTVTVFLILALSKITQIMHSAWIRMDQATFLIHQQQSSIEYAKRIADEEGFHEQ